MSALQISPQDWEYADATDISTATWSKCSQFPTEIHHELRKAGVIPDWNVGRTEHKVQWVCQKSWAFRSVIRLDATQYERKYGELEFEGLDTFATVYLNGKEILKADNHFRTWKIKVETSDLKEANQLVIIFKPPQEEAKKVWDQHGPFKGGSCNLGDRSRIGIRKSQYHARWDWGPELWCIGPDRPITLHLFDVRIKTLRTDAKVDEYLFKNLTVQVDYEGEAEVWGLVLTDQNGNVIKRQQYRRTFSIMLEDLNVDLWWPVGEGEQILYTLKVDLYGQDGSVVDSLTHKIGFRAIELVQTRLKDAEGTSFYFKINSKPIFMSGSNWIPIDMILPTGSPERYRKWLELLVKGGQNMIRVWGGGVFEPDIFYEICDELGILVWQDCELLPFKTPFQWGAKQLINVVMFACGVYPAHPEFLKSVEAEARDNVTRIRHHPSLVLFCGNNEDYQQIQQWDMSQDGDPLPARVIYEKLLPDIVRGLTGPDEPIPYWPGSPYGGKGWDTADPTIGDIHQWDVWAGTRNYMDYDIMGGRFVSEFGLPAMPNMRTVEYWLDGDQSQAYPQSKLMQQHNKAGSHERRFALVMNENFRLSGDLEEYLFRNQLMQAEGIGHAYRSWRREWKGPEREYCGGVLVWQLNDCWPVTSWALIDYFYRPKPAYFAVKRAIAPFSLGISRIVTKNRENDRPRQYYEYGAFQSRSVSVEVWACNSRAQQKVKFTLSAYDLATPWKKLPFIQKTVTLGENRSTELWKGVGPAPTLTESDDWDAPSGSVVLMAKIESEDGREVLARYCDWPLPYKLLEFPDPNLKVEVKGESVVISADKPAKGVWLDVEGSDGGIEWSDNSIDVFPGEEYTIAAKGISGKTVTCCCLGYEKLQKVEQ